MLRRVVFFLIIFQIMAVTTAQDERTKPILNTQIGKAVQGSIPLPNGDGKITIPAKLPVQTVQFEGKAGQSIVFNVIGSNYSDANLVDRITLLGSHDYLIFAPQVQLVSPNGKLLSTLKTEIKDNNDKRQVPAATSEVIKLPANGKYSFTITGTREDPYGDYILAVASVDADQPDFRLVSIGEEVEGGLVGNDSNKWIFAGKAGDTVTITMGGQGDSQLRLLDATGKLIADNNDFNGSDSQIGPLKLPADGQYQIVSKMNIFNFGGYDGSWSGGGIYNLKVINGSNTANLNIVPFENVESAFTQDHREDTWTFQAEAGQYIVISTTSDLFATSVELHGPKSDVLTESDGKNPGLNQLQPFELPETGTYQIVVKPSGGSEGEGKYTLVVSRVDPNIQQFTIEPGQTAVERLVFRNDQHIWKFKGEKGEFIRIDLRTYGNAQLALLGPDGNAVKTGFDILQQNIRLPQTGEYQLQIKPDEYGNSPVTSYSLAINQLRVDANEQHLALGQVMVGSNITPNKDNLQFQVNSLEPVEFLVYVSGYNSSYYQMDFISPENEVTNVNGYSGSGSGRTSVFSFTPDKAGTYAASLGDSSGSGGQPFYYITSMQTPGASSPLTHSVFEGDGPEDGEIQIGHYVVASSANELDDTRSVGADPHVNEWTFEGTAGQTLRLKTNAIPSGGYGEGYTEADLKIYQPSGELLVDYYSRGYIDYSPISLPQTGKYKINIITYGGNFQMALLPYSPDVITEGVLMPFGEYAGNLQAYGQPTTWLFDGKAGETVTLRLTGGWPDVNNVPLDNYSADPLLELYAPDGTFVAESDDFDGFNSLIGPIKLPVDGLYQVAISDYNGQGGSYSIVLFEGEMNILGDKATAVDQCTNLVRNSLEELRKVCTDANGNNLCFGNGPFKAQLSNGANPISYANPGDSVSMESLQSLALNSMDRSVNAWSAGRVRTRTTFVRGSGVTDVTMLLLGNVQLQNPKVEAIPEEDTSNLVSLDVHAVPKKKVTIRNSAASSGTAIGQMSETDVLKANGRTKDGKWFRVTLPNGLLGWVSKDVVTVDGDTESLAVLTLPPQKNKPSALSFYATTGSDDAQCKRAPESGIVLHSYNGEQNPVFVVINDVRIEFTNTVYVQAQAGSLMTVYVIDGQATVRAQNKRVFTYKSSKVTIPLSGDLKAAGGPSEAVQYEFTEVRALPLRYIN
jgi:hypothetical protein